MNDRHTSSLYIVYNVCNEYDKVHEIAAKICEEFRGDDIQCATSNQDFCWSERRLCISSACWVIVVCSERNVQDGLFPLEEKLALFEAMSKGRQNVIYILTSHVPYVVCKGFDFIRTTGDNDWIKELKFVLSTRPVAMDTHFFNNFCRALEIIETDSLWFLPIFQGCFAVPNKYTENNNTITWNLKEDELSTEYVVSCVDDSVKLRPVEHILEDISHLSHTKNKTGIIEKIKTPSIEVCVKWSVSEKSKNTFTLTLIYLLLLLWGTLGVLSVLPSIVSEYYFPQAQIWFLVMSSGLSVSNVLHCVKNKDPQLTFISVCQSLFILVAIVLPLVDIHNLNDYVHLFSASGISCVFSLINLGLFNDLLASMTNSRKAKSGYKELNLYFSTLMIFIIVYHSVIKFHGFGVSPRTLFKIMFLVLASQIGYFSLLFIYFKHVLKPINFEGFSVKLYFCVIVACLWFAPVVVSYRYQM